MRSSGLARVRSRRRGRDGCSVERTVRATVRQTCVVTLEPVVNEIDEAVDVDFVPARGRAATPGRNRY
jgi:hypothetical protein